MPTTLSFETWDVFTDTMFTGNPLAVVRGADGLADADLRAIAREFNLSETVFLMPPTRGEALVDVRIFTPARELPFAGHPTVGAAISLAAAGAMAPRGDGMARFVMNEKIGPVPVTVAFAADGRRPVTATFTTAVAPTEQPRPGLSEAAWAAMAGLPAAAILADRIGVWSAGVPFPIVPVTDRAALGRARPTGAALAPAASSGGPADGAPADPAQAGLSDPMIDSVYLVAGDPRAALGTADRPGRIDARLFAPGMGIPEDPATGSAAAALAGWLARQAPADGVYATMIVQGEDMGRRSEIALTVTVRNGQAVRTDVGGAAVPVMRG
jgi:trans-2,3-dihydro-3-hydroxyanthranilate isomerase